MEQSVTLLSSCRKLYFWNVFRRNRLGAEVPIMSSHIGADHLRRVTADMILKILAQQPRSVPARVLLIEQEARAFDPAQAQNECFGCNAALSARERPKSYALEHVLALSGEVYSDGTCVNKQQQVRI